MRFALLLTILLALGLSSVMALGFISADLRDIPQNQYRLQNCKMYGTNAFCDVAFQNGKMSAMHMGRFNSTPTLTQIRTANDLKIQRIVAPRINAINRAPIPPTSRIIAGNITSTVDSSRLIAPVETIQ